MKFQKMVAFNIYILSFMAMNLVYAGDFINQHLPEYLKADVELRHRLEYKNDFDFNGQKDDEDTYGLYRTRVSLAYIPFSQLKFLIQGQDAKVSHLSTGNKSAMRNLWDIRQSYVKFENAVPGNVLGVHRAAIQGGRQEFVYGAQRLIGAFNWSNVAQTFDGVRGQMNFSFMDTQLDVITGSKVGFRSPQDKRANRLFDASSKDMVYAYYAKAKAFEAAVLENYLIHRKTWKNISFGPNGSGEIDNYTFGGRLIDKLPYRFDYEVEVAGQWGNFNDKDVRAAMAVGIIGYTFDHAWEPRAAFEFDYASGGSSSGKTLKTFDNLYPTNHLYYGYMDLISLQNLNNYRYQFSVKPTKKLKLQADVHMIYLDTPKDAFYSAGRAVTRTASAGSVGVSSHVGNEIDVTADYKFNAYLSLQAGYGHLFAGDYLKDTGANDDVDFFFLQTTVSF